MWNHNSHFHNYLLRQCPVNIRRALDIGCGLGLFAQRLAERSEVVDAIDADNIILNEASNRNAASNVHYFHAGFLKADLPEASYEAIAAIASLHHMDLEAALTKMKALLCPSGKLILRAGRPPIYWGMRASAGLTNSTKLSSYTKDFICCKIAPTLNHSCVLKVGLFVPRKTTVM